MELDLKRLQQVLTVAHSGSISRAAEELHLTQPALSRSIALLEDRYGFRIFERHRGGAQLTPLGKSLVREAEGLLRAARTVDHNLRQFQRGDAGYITFGMGPLLSSLLLPGLSQYLLNTRPNLTVEVISKSAEALYQALMNEELECLLCSGNPLASRAGIQIEVVGHIPLAMLVRHDHPLAQSSTIAQEQLQDYPILSGAEGGIAQSERTAGAFICDNYHILRGTTLHTDGIWISSPALAKDDLDNGTLVQLPLQSSRLPSNAPVTLVCPEGRQLSPAGEVIADYVRAFFNAS